MRSKSSYMNTVQCHNWNIDTEMLGKLKTCVFRETVQRQRNPSWLLNDGDNK